MGSVNDNIRNVKRAYRKKAFQSGYSVAGDSVEATPVPQHTYSTTTTQQTSVVRPGLDARTYLRGDGKDGPQAVYSAGTDKVLDLARYPWSLIPKGDSSNVIQRQLIQFAAADSATTVLLADNEFVDALVINVTETNIPGTQFWSGAGTADAFPIGQPIGNIAAPVLPTVLANFVPTGADTTTGVNTRFPLQGGLSQAGVAGTSQLGSDNEYYKISKFGHALVPRPAGATADKLLNPIRYQIWIDGSLAISWSDFQWGQTNFSDLWQFESPIVVEQQIVFRIINESGAAIATGAEADAVFVGWTEQYYGYFDTTSQAIKTV
jgi:hypothetical protein